MFPQYVLNARVVPGELCRINFSNMHTVPVFTVLNAAGAAAIACLFIVLASLLKEPQRQKLMAIILAGAGAAYLSGGLGAWEFVFCSLMTFIAYKGLASYYYIAAGWLLHTGWDVLHHLYANPIVVFNPSSSAGCAVCDSLLAIWFFCKAPGVFDAVRNRRISMGE